MRSAAVLLVAALIGGAGVGACTPPPPGAGNPNATPDFDHNGQADVVVSIDQEDLNGQVDAGAVDVIYGSAFSSAPRHQFLSQADAAVPGDPEAGGRFGDDTAAGDFNGDGYDDLAIGAWGDTVNAKAKAGRVFVLFGSATGLTTTTVQAIDQESNGIGGNADIDDEFGRALAAGDLNGDGKDDLAVGAPRDNPGNVNNAGSVTVLFGSGSGLVTTTSRFYQQGSGGLPDTLEKDDTFGAAVAIGDLDGDTRGDLIVGAPSEDLANPTRVDAGIVHVLYGDASGAVGTRNTTVTGDTGSLPEDAQAGDRFGCFSSVGDFNGDGRIDVEIGADGRTVDGIATAGAVYVLFSGASGLSTTGSQLWHENSAGVPDAAESLDNFGDSTAAGDFDHDGYTDLAVSDDKEDLTGVAGTDQGAVYVFRGSASGLTTTGLQFLTQDSAGIPDTAENLDEFASLVQAGDFNGDSYDDLYVAAGGETIDGAANAGLLHLLPGGASGITGSGSVTFQQGVNSTPDSTEANDFFGGT
jgi:FG-GAP repeat protein